MCKACYLRLHKGNEPRTVAEKDFYYAKMDFEEHFPRGGVTSCSHCQRDLLRKTFSEKRLTCPHPLLRNPRDGSIGMWLCKKCNNAVKETGDLPSLNPDRSPNCDQSWFEFDICSDA